MSSEAARFWLVRHGQTDWNVAGRVQGHTPTGLNAEGFRQAGELARFLESRRFAAVWASDLPRALETAEAVAGPRGMRVETADALRERSFGRFEGMSGAELKAARAELGMGPMVDLTDWTGMPGVESEDGLWGRVSGFLRGLSGRYAGEDVLVVTHGGVVARAVYRVLGIADGTPRRFPVSNGMIAVIEPRGEGWQLLSLLETALLEGKGPARDTSVVGVG